VINVAIRSAEKVLKALSALLPRTTIRTRITEANEDFKKICSVVDCWYTAKLTRSRAVKQDWFVRWNTGNKHRQNNNNNIASASSSQKINPIKILN
jgi:hypothetical protein